MTRTREHLLGYLLEALEPAEMAAVERELEQDPQLRWDLAAIESALVPLGFPERDDDASAEDPPRQLAARTCEFIDDAKQDLVPRRSPQPMLVRAMSQDRLDGERRVRWSDVVVSASVALAAIALLFPAVWSSRESARIAACQENLRHLGLAVAQWASFSEDGCIPAVPVSGNRSTAGIYAALLQEHGLLEDTRYLVCPSSGLANQATTYRVPSLVEIDRSGGDALAQLQRTMGGSYGYNLGYIENGRYYAPRYQGRSHYALLSDAPATFRPQRTSKNHGSRGQNILYEDNHVRFFVNVCDDLSDDPYLNRNGLVAAGVDCADVVLAESPAKPIPPTIDPLP